MADSQQPSQKAPSNRQVLEHAFSPAVVDAIDGRIREVSLETLAEVRQQLVDMIEEHKRTIAAVRAMPASPQRDEAARATDETSDKLTASADRLNGVIEESKAGQPVEPERADQAAESVDQAGKAVKETSEGVSRQLAALQERSDQHQAILAVEHDGERPPSRVDALERRMDDAERRMDEHEGVIATAFSYARAAVNGDTAWRKAAMVGLVAFVVTLLLYCLLVLVTPVMWEWDNALGVPAIIAGLAAAIMLLRSGSASADVESYSYAQAATHTADRNRRQREREEERQQQDERSDQEGVSILPRDDREEQDDRQEASASSGAHASAR